MTREDFSADATCRAMGLGGFVEPSWAESPGPAFRVILSPAFHDEVCVTAAGAKTNPTAEVVTLRRLHWPGGVTRRHVSSRETTPIDPVEVEALLADLLAAHAESLTEDPYFWRDGICLECGWVVDGRAIGPAWINGNRDLANRFAARLVRLVAGAAKTRPIRDALARAGEYVGMKLDPAPEPATMVTLIGDPWDKAGLMDAVGAIGQRRPGAAPPAEVKLASRRGQGP